MNIRAHGIWSRIGLAAALLLLLTGLGATPAFAFVPATTETFSTPPILGPSQTAVPGAWYVDRKAPAAFDSVVFGGDARLHIGIDGADRDAGNNFYNTQGRKLDVETGDGTSMQGDLYIGPDWETNSRRSDLWATGVDGAGNVTSFPVLGFINGTGFRAFDQTSGWHTVGFPTGFSYGRWYTLRVVVGPTDLKYYIDGNLVYTDVDNGGTTRFSNVMLQAYNFGASYDVYWDNVSPGTVGAGGGGPTQPVPADSPWSLALLAIAGSALAVLVGSRAARGGQGA
jgi:hypothetical protein